MSEKEANPNIKDVEIVNPGADAIFSGEGHPSLPNSPNPGHAVNYPTCSEPGGRNKGCDAWAKCVTKGKGPYHVAFINPHGRKSTMHCRHWMYKYQYKQALGYRPVGNDWEEAKENERINPNDPNDKRFVEKRYKYRVQNVKNPIELMDKSPSSPQRVNPDLDDPIERSDVQYGEVQAQAESPAPVEGIKHGNRRKGNQVEASGE